MIADTRAVWEPMYGRPLTNDEIIEILLNAAGVLRVLFGLRSSASTVNRLLDARQRRRRPPPTKPATPPE